ncbi:MAG: hypothetical protein KHZ15_09165 [Coprobacillus cateniformis]|uniref:hypothetical protein n=1 Tax=Longibaculum muris TaxID=1796628 RepID=UPI003AB49792|nr:hypothetical protein [Coprobacillus cateniformis]
MNCIHLLRMKKFLDDLKQIENILTDTKKYPDLEQNEITLTDYLNQENRLDDLVEKMYFYIILTMNTNTNN